MVLNSVAGFRLSVTDVNGDLITYVRENPLSPADKSTQVSVLTRNIPSVFTLLYTLCLRQYLTSRLKLISNYI